MIEYNNLTHFTDMISNRVFITDLFMSLELLIMYSSHEYTIGAVLLQHAVISERLTFSAYLNGVKS